MKELNFEALTEKWNPILEAEGFAPIQSEYRKQVTAAALENMVFEGAVKSDIWKNQTLTEAVPANFSAGLGGTTANTSGIDAYDPILISLVRRALPNLMAYDICGVQPMNGPTGLIFAIKANYTDRNGAEALFNEANTAFTGAGAHQGTNPANGYAGSYGFQGSQGYLVGTGMTTAIGEDLGGANPWAEMAFTIEKTRVDAVTRGVYAGYTVELEQDLRAIHGLSARGELTNMLSQEMLFELNRQVVRTIYRVAKQGALSTAAPGTFDLDVDSNGRWSVERFKGLMFQLEREANTIGQETRRGKGNIIICSSDVASALAMTGKLDYTPALDGNGNIQVDDTGNTFAGVLNGRFKVFIDPYAANINSANQFAVVGYKGSSQYDAGLFYCPYVPLQKFEAMDPTTMQPRMAFKSRYGLVSNPFVEASPGTPDAQTLTVGKNQYYRGFRVNNLM